MDYTDIVTQFLQFESKHQAARYLMSLNLTMDQFFDIGHLIKQTIKANKKKKYVYMLTFTLDPKKVPEITSEIEDNVEAMVHNQGCRTALQIIEYAYVKEYHKNGRPHWHALIVTNTNLKKDRFKNFIDKYGNIDISKNKAQNTADIIDYITKVGEIKRVV